MPSTSSPRAAQEGVIRPHENQKTQAPAGGPVRADHAGAFHRVLGYAAYYGTGNFKDVFVNRRNCFTSDVLASVSDREEVPRSTIYFSSGKVINLFNYDLSTGEYNAFSMEFSVYAWLDKTPADGRNTI